jgi:membrane protease YdiL (CAAX protease family)
VLLLVASLAVVVGLTVPEVGLSVEQKLLAAGAYLFMAVLIGDGSRRYATARLRDYGREVARTDRPFAVYAAIGLSLLAFLLGQAVSIAALPFLGVDPDPLVLYPVLFVVQYAGFALVALGFLYATHRGLRYLDLSVPSGRDLAMIVGGVVASLGIWAAASILITGLGLPATDHALFEPGEAGSEGLLLLLIPLVLLVNGPVEELLYRNVIQKYLAERFSTPVAIATASAVFALAHVPAYFTAGLTALSVTLSLLFVVSCLWGLIYARTESLVVVSVIHGLYNALLIAGLYVQIS